MCIFYRTWGSEPPSHAADMLRWLASLSYQTISERAGQYLSEPELVGKSDTDGLEPALNPKAAVFEVRTCIFV